MHAAALELLARLGAPAPRRVIVCADPREGALLAALLARSSAQRGPCRVRTAGHAHVPHVRAGGIEPRRGLARRGGPLHRDGPLPDALRDELALPVPDAVFARAWTLAYGAPPGAWTRAMPRPVLDAPPDPEAPALPGGWWVRGSTAVLAEPPVITRRDESGRLHAADGPALAWPGGFAVHVWHGVWLPPGWRGDPDGIDPAQVIALGDLRLRRAVIDRLGLARMLAGPVRVLDRERDRWLLRLELPGDEPLVALQVCCPSTGHTHLLRVPPRTRTCPEAVAWTFAFEAHAFRPVAET